MKCASSIVSLVQTQVAKHIKGDSVFNMLPRSDSIDCFLHFAVASVSAFDGIRGRGQQLVVQKLKAFFQCRRVQFRKAVRKFLETLDPHAKFSQFFKGRLRPASTVVKSIHLIHDFTQFSQFRQAFGDVMQCFTFLRRQNFLHKQVTVLEQCRDFFLDAIVFANGLFVFLRCRTTAFAAFHFGFFEFTPNLGDRLQNGFVDFLFDVKFTKLMTHIGKDFRNRLRVKMRTVGRDAVKFKAAFFQNALKRAEQFANVVMLRGMVENAIRQTLVLAVVDDGKHAERTVVKFVDGDVTRKMFKRPIEIFVGFNLCADFFSPMPRPSFESLRTARTRDDPAINANSPHDKANRPRQRPERQVRRPAWCKANRVRPRRKGRRRNIFDNMGSDEWKKGTPHRRDVPFHGCPDRAEYADWYAFAKSGDDKSDTVPTSDSVCVFSDVAWANPRRGQSLPLHRKRIHQDQTWAIPP